jgi:hypothetical protein
MRVGQMAFTTGKKESSSAARAGAARDRRSRRERRRVGEGEVRWCCVRVVMRVSRV